MCAELQRGQRIGASLAGEMARTWRSRSQAKRWDLPDRWRYAAQFERLDVDESERVALLKTGLRHRFEYRMPGDKMTQMVCGCAARNLDRAHALPTRQTDRRPLAARERAPVSTDVVASTGQDARPMQCGMILSNDPATYVVAGSGSAVDIACSSCHRVEPDRGIDRRHISDSTFTKESLKDFVPLLGFGPGRNFGPRLLSYPGA